MSIREIEFRPLGRTVPFLAFGCGTLNGRASLKRSARLVEAALDLGIRYFDVAPSYGAGTAEEVLGYVIGDSKDVVIATKHGIPRPAHRPFQQQVRRIMKPVIDRSIRVKRFLQYTLRRPTRQCHGQHRHDFTRSAVESSLETSLRLLRRATVDVFLAHEPIAEDFTPEIASNFERMVSAGMARCFGAAIGGEGECVPFFGNVWQSRWPDPMTTIVEGDITRVFHGLLRYRHGMPSPVCEVDLGERLRAFSLLAPDSILIVSASTPERLRQVAQAAAG